MALKRIVMAAVICVLPAIRVLECSAVDTSGINTVREKAVLDGSDLQTIDRFVQEAVDELVGTTDFSSISKARSIILACSKGAAEAQYGQQYTQSCRVHIGAALSQAEKIAEPQRRARVIANLLILIDGLADPGMVDLSLKYVGNDDKVVRYWAVHSLTNSEFMKGLEAEGAGAVVPMREIGEALEGIADTSGPETLEMIVNFAVQSNSAQSEQLLLKVADARIREYAAGDVQYELMEVDLLKALGGLMSSNPEAGSRFGQLFSYVIQRYVHEQDLTEVEDGYLVTVMVETERTVISKLLKPQAAIKLAIENDSMDALMAEHDRLLGTSTSKGELGIDYGGSNGPKQLSALARG